MATSEIEAFVVDRLQNAFFENEPFPHFYIDNVFPPGLYQEILAKMPTDAEFTPSDREFNPGEIVYALRGDEAGLARLNELKQAFWREMSSWMLSESFMRSTASLFYPELKQRFADRPNTQFTSSFSLGRAKSGWILGPHTDMAHRVLTILFYLPERDQTPLPGTSMYKSRDANFICHGGPHYGFENFQKVATIQFKPNTAFGFVKTLKSFHGVEPWAEREFIRDTLQYELHDADRTFYYGPNR